MFSNTLKRKGYKVYTLDFVNPMNSCGYNPLRAIRRKPNGKYREQDILSLATAITPILDKDEPFWEKAASGYIASLIAFCLETCGVQDRNLKTVCELHHIFISEQVRWLQRTFRKIWLRWEFLQGLLKAFLRRKSNEKRTYHFSFQQVLVREAIPRALPLNSQGA